MKDLYEHLEGCDFQEFTANDDNKLYEEAKDSIQYQIDYYKDVLKNLKFYRQYTKEQCLLEIAKFSELLDKMKTQRDTVICTAKRWIVEAEKEYKEMLDDDDWKETWAHEIAHQAGMSGGCESYNDYMGY